MTPPSSIPSPRSTSSASRLRALCGPSEHPLELDASIGRPRTASIAKRALASAPRPRILAATTASTPPRPPSCLDEQIQPERRSAGALPQVDGLASRRCRDPARRRIGRRRADRAAAAAWCESPCRPRGRSTEKRRIGRRPATGARRRRVPGLVRSRRSRGRGSGTARRRPGRPTGGRRRTGASDAPPAGGGPTRRCGSRRARRPRRSGSSRPRNVRSSLAAARRRRSGAAAARGTLASGS